MQRLIFFLLLTGLGAPIIFAEEAPKPGVSTLEGKLEIHPKYLYKYYLVAYGGQLCALYGKDQARECDLLKDIEPGTHIRVRGRLGTSHHPGGTRDNPSPFPRSWTIYMEVEQAELVDRESDQPPE